MKNTPYYQKHKIENSILEAIEELDQWDDYDDYSPIQMIKLDDIGLGARINNFIIEKLGDQVNEDVNFSENFFCAIFDSLNIKYIRECLGEMVIDKEIETESWKDNVREHCNPSYFLSLK